MTGVALAFLRRDFIIWSSYRVAVLRQVLEVLVLTAVVYFIGRTVGDDVPNIARYGGSYVAFLFSGLAFTQIFAQGLYSPAQAIMENQQAGTLEPMLVTPLPQLHFIIASSLFSLIVSLVRMAAFIAVAVLALGFWRDAHILSALIVFLPGVLAFFGMGILSAASVVVTKRSDPVIAAYGAMTAVLGGMLFPVEALPPWLQALAIVVPFNHALTGMRLALQGEPPSAVALQAVVLVAIAVVLLPTALVAFNWAVNRAKLEGSLAQY